MNKAPTARKRKSAVLLRMGKYFGRHKLLVALAFFLTIASNLLALLGPYLSGCAINAIDTPDGIVDFDSVFFYCALMALFYIASAAMSYLLSVVMIKLSQKIVRQMRRDVFNKLMSLPVGFFDKLQAGDLINRISYDIDTVNASLSNDIIQISTGVHYRRRFFHKYACYFTRSAVGICRNHSRIGDFYDKKEQILAAVFPRKVGKACGA